MKVLLIGSSRNIGMTHNLTRLSIGLKKQGIEICVASSGFEQVPGLFNDLSVEHIKHYRVKRIDDRSLLSYYECARELSAIIDEEKIEVIHTQGIIQLIKSYLSCVMMSGNKKPSILMTIHSSYVFENSPARFLLRITSRLADRLSPLCEESKTRLMAMGINENKIVFIPNAIDLEYFDTVLKSNYEDDLLGKRFNMGSGAIIAYVAALKLAKGHEYFLLAAKKILESHPNTLFLVVGDGERKSELALKVKEFNIKNNVIFTGFVNSNKMPSLLKRIDIGASSSLAEQFPYSILELMSASKPVVATCVGAIPTIVQDGVSGYIVPPKDSDALAAKIQILIENLNLAKRMGQQGRKLIEENYQMKVIAPLLIDLYESMKADKAKKSKEGN